MAGLIPHPCRYPPPPRALIASLITSSLAPSSLSFLPSPFRSFHSALPIRTYPLLFRTANFRGFLACPRCFFSSAFSPSFSSSSSASYSTRSLSHSHFQSQSQSQPQRRDHSDSHSCAPFRSDSSSLALPESLSPSPSSVKATIQIKKQWKAEAQARARAVRVAANEASHVGSGSNIWSVVQPRWRRRGYLHDEPRIILGRKNTKTGKMSGMSKKRFFEAQMQRAEWELTRMEQWSSHILQHEQRKARGLHLRLQPPEKENAAIRAATREASLTLSNAEETEAIQIEVNSVNSSSLPSASSVPSLSPSSSPSTPAELARQLRSNLLRLSKHHADGERSPCATTLYQDLYALLMQGPTSSQCRLLIKTLLKAKVKTSQGKKRKNTDQPIAVLDSSCSPGCYNSIVTAALTALTFVRLYMILHSYCCAHKHDFLLSWKDPALHSYNIIDLCHNAVNLYRQAQSTGASVIQITASAHPHQWLTPHFDPTFDSSVDPSTSSSSYSSPSSNPFYYISSRYLGDCIGEMIYFYHDRLDLSISKWLDAYRFTGEGSAELEASLMMIEIWREQQQEQELVRQQRQGSTETDIASVNRTLRLPSTVYTHCSFEMKKAFTAAVRALPRSFFADLHIAALQALDQLVQNQAQSEQKQAAKNEEEQTEKLDQKEEQKPSEIVDFNIKLKEVRELRKQNLYRRPGTVNRMELSSFTTPSLSSLDLYSLSPSQLALHLWSSFLLSRSTSASHPSLTPILIPLFNILASSSELNSIKRIIAELHETREEMDDAIYEMVIPICNWNQDTEYAKYLEQILIAGRKEKEELEAQKKVEEEKRKEEESEQDEERKAAEQMSLETKEKIKQLRKLRKMQSKEAIRQWREAQMVVFPSSTSSILVVAPDQDDFNGAAEVAGKDASIEVRSSESELTSNSAELSSLLPDFNAVTPEFASGVERKEEEEERLGANVLELTAQQLEWFRYRSQFPSRQ